MYLIFLLSKFFEIENFEKRNIFYILSLIDLESIIEQVKERTKKNMCIII